MKIATVPFSPVWKNLSANLKLMVEILDNHALDDLDLVVFPEASLSGFAVSGNYELPENLEVELASLAAWAKTHSVSILFGALIREGDCRYNSAIHISGSTGSIEVVYRKIYLFSAAGENQHFTPGSELGILQLPGFSLGIAICFDLRSQALFRRYKCMAVDAVLVLANWPAVRQDHFENLLKARALDMQFVTVGINRGGGDPVSGEYVSDALGFYADGSSLLFRERGELRVVTLESDYMKSKELELMGGIYERDKWC